MNPPAAAPILSTARAIVSLRALQLARRAIMAVIGFILVLSRVIGSLSAMGRVED